ncbi:MAG: carbamate kinase [Parachlamydiales bacterium]|nr:carbamate kinase [Parachlamydiales bacterium]
MGEKVLIALGGNALLQSGEKGTYQDQLAHVQETCVRFLEIIKAGHTIAITHGNGPQVGAILLQNESAQEKIPSMPLDVCGAESQGFIGYMLQRCLVNEQKKHQQNTPVVTILTQTRVDRHDPAFQNPTKPIGPFYTKEQAEGLKKEKKWTMVEQIGKGFRRVVPSPEPVDIIEGNIIKHLFEEKMIVIACGGGGIPVIQENGKIEGVEAVIDKDHTAAVLAQVIGAEILVILTDVEKVALHYKQPNEKLLSRLTVAQAQEHLSAGEFPKGSMGPKVEAACAFVQGGGKKAIITSLEKSKEALEGKTGTIITMQ